MTLIPEIESALVRAVEQDIAIRKTRPRRLRAASDWLRARNRGMAVVVVALLTAGATAAAVSLSGEESRPLSGTIPAYGPGGVVTPSLGTLHYSIGGLVPSLAPGRVGWCTSDWIAGRVRISGRSVPTGQGGTSCSYAAALGRPIFASDGGHGPGVHFFLTAPNVAAVRVNGRLTVLTRTDPTLPFGLRAAVFQARLDFTRAVALDRSGRVIKASPAALPFPPTTSWRGQRARPGGACSITLSPPSGLRLLAGIVIRAVVPAAGLQAPAFLPCVQVQLLDGQFFLDAALLLDAGDPGSRPAPLPGMQPLPGHPGWYDWRQPRPYPDGGDRGLNPGFDPRGSAAGLFDPLMIPSLDGGLSARRVGNAWLVVQGGKDSAQRIAALAALRPGQVQTRVPVAIRRPAGVRCWLTVRGLPGLVAVDEQHEPASLLPRRLRGECLVAASFYLHKWPVEVLFGSPYRPPDTFGPPESSAPALTIRRGSGWLQVIGGSGPAQRRQLAAAATVVER